MRFIITLLLLFSLSTISAQNLEADKEELEKYGYLIKEIPMISAPKPSTISKLDSLYQLDSNSTLLKSIIIEANIRLLYGELNFERLPQTISMLNSLISSKSDSNALKRTYFTLANLYEYLGEFEKSIYYYTEIQNFEIDNTKRMVILENIANNYLNMGMAEKALMIIRTVVPDEERGINNRTFARVYLENNYSDSALYHINITIEEGHSSYLTYLIKAQALIQKGQTQEICQLVRNAKDFIDEEQLEARLLANKDYNNAYIKLLWEKINLTKQLKKEYCN